MEREKELYDIDESKAQTALFGILNMEKRLPENFDPKKEQQESRMFFPIRKLEKREFAEENRMKSICGIDCTNCELSGACNGCAATGGYPFGAECAERFLYQH